MLRGILLDSAHLCRSLWSHPPPTVTTAAICLYCSPSQTSPKETVSPTAQVAIYLFLCTLSLQPPTHRPRSPLIYPLFLDCPPSKQHPEPRSQSRPPDRRPHFSEFFLHWRRLSPRLHLKDLLQQDLALHQSVQFVQLLIPFQGRPPSGSLHSDRSRSSSLACYCWVQYPSCL